MYNFEQEGPIYILLGKQDHAHMGIIKVRFIKGRLGKGSVCYAELHLFYANPLGVTGVFTGKANGGFYDRASTAIADACKSAGILADFNVCDNFVFNRDKQFATSYCLDQLKVPVYAGNGNQKEAFSLFFDIIEV
jgi:hypothetical protein